MLGLLGRLGEQETTKGWLDVFTTASMLGTVVPMFYIVLQIVLHGKVTLNESNLPIIYGELMFMALLVGLGAYKLFGDVKKFGIELGKKAKWNEQRRQFYEN